jgi:uncharacterized protein YndB with AHSA1/START domain
MTGRSVEHAKLTIEREYNASPAQVFAAWASVEARQVWGVPAPDVAIRFDEANFRIGGRDLSRCGKKGEPTYLCEAIYLDIVEDRRIIFTEAIEHRSVRLSASLLTVEFASEGSGTRLKLTAQIAALDGSAMIEGYESGWTPALVNLAAYLEETGRESALSGGAGAVETRLERLQPGR